MTDFLFRLLQMSVMGSLLAGLILLWRRFLRKEAVNTVFYYMWLLVLLRLCVPLGVTVSLPVAEKWMLESRASMAESEAGQQLSLDNAEAPGAAKAGSPYTPPADMSSSDMSPEDMLSSDMPPEDMLSSDMLPPSDTSLSSDAPAGADAAWKAAHGLWGIFGMPALWVLLWGAGAAVCLGRYVAGYVRFAHAVGKAAVSAPQKAWEVLRELAKGGRVRIVECPFAATPMLIGLLRPTIVLPAGIGDEGQLRDILAHELVHARRRDLLYKWFAVAVTSLHWFNPVMILVRREVGRACELSCDEAVVRGMDTEGRRHYGETLLSLAESCPADSGLVAMTLCEEKERLKERLMSIAAYRKKGAMAVLVSVYVLIHLGGCAMISGADFVRADAPGEKANLSASETQPAGEKAADAANAEAAEDLPDAGRGPEDESPDGSGSGAVDLLREVLLGEKTFLCENGGSGTVSRYIDELPEIFSPGSEYGKIWKFAVIDLDGDGEEEAIVRVIDAAGDRGGCMVFHCSDGEVFGFAKSYQAFEVLKTDGTYNDRGGGVLDGVCRMRFAGQTCTFDWLISCSTAGTAKEAGEESGAPELAYFVGGGPATEEEWSAALNEQGEKADAQWYFYSEETVNERLGASDFSFIYTPDGEKPEDEAAKPDSGGGDALPSDKDVSGMYRFPVRVSEMRVLNVVLEPSEPEKDYFSVARIYVYDGESLIQTIETADVVPPEDYLWEGLFVNKGYEEGEPDVRDVTFDGAEDFGLLCASAYPKNLPFTYFYWNEAEGRFVQGFTVFGGDALEVDYEQKCLIEHWNDVNGAHTTRYA